MIEIGGKPILWHIMKIYSYFGYNDFILALGFKGNLIREYFLNYEYFQSDLTITLGTRKHIQIHGETQESNWKVTLVDTGLDSMTGYRIKQCINYITEENFLLTYGDGLANIDIKKLVDFHLSHGKIGTITSVNSPSRFGEIEDESNVVTNFVEKPLLIKKRDGINGGFMVFKKDFINYLSSEPDCVLEMAPLVNLTNDRQLMVYHHHDFWQCMDTYRDYLLLQKIWDGSKAPWKFE